VATLACLAPPADADSFASTCDQIANTMQLSSGEPLPVGPNEAYAGTVSKALGSLGKAEKAGLAKLKSAKTPQEQSAAAKSLAGMIPSTGLFTVIAEVKPVGMHSSDQVVGGPIDFPIDLCNGCLVDVVGACPLPKGTIVTTPCFPQQDEVTTCCNDPTQGLLCNEAAPVATM